MIHELDKDTTHLEEILERVALLDERVKEFHKKDPEDKST